MKKIIFGLCLVMFASGCSGNKGVEVTNPDADLITNLETKTIRVVPSSGTDYYLVRVLDTESARVTRVKDNVVLDVVTAPIESSTNRISITVTVSGMVVRIIIIGDDDGDIVGIELYIDDSSVDVTYDSLTPANSDDGDGSSSSSSSSYTSAIDPSALVYDMCNIITDCFRDVSYSLCENELFYSTSIPDNFGVSVSDGDITMERALGAYEANQDNLSGCLDAINSMSCDDLRVGFDPADPENYDNIENIIPEVECADVFSE